uniref:Uncharacterized protein n=1 Tax=Rhizophora mucronata TaxID=61149 RepID=A0A2P2MXA4_RHIMU
MFLRYFMFLHCISPTSFPPFFFSDHVQPEVFFIFLICVINVSPLLWGNRRHRPIPIMCCQHFHNTSIHICLSC